MVACHCKLCRPHLLFAMVLAQVQPLKDVAVPRLQVDSKGTLALAATLVHIPGPGMPNAGCACQLCSSVVREHSSTGRLLDFKVGPHVR